MHHTRAMALGHVRNATWHLLNADTHPGVDGLILGLECLDLEALLNPDDTEPALVPPEPGPAASLAAASQLLAAHLDEVPPAAWAALCALELKLG